MNKPADTTLSTTQDTAHVLIMAAGTGGHVFPALAVAKELQAQGVKVTWLGTPAGRENEWVGRAGFSIRHVNMQGLRNKGIKRLLGLPFTLSGAVLAAIRIIRSERIDAVIGFGGYVTAPGGLAARICGVPLLIHEQNAIAGMSNRYLAKIAVRVLQAFDGTFAESPKLRTVGNPVRNDIESISTPEMRWQITEQAEDSHDNVSDCLNILIVGGSLGARPLNEVMAATLEQLNTDTVSINVRHQCGRDNLAATLARYEAVTLSSNIQYEVIEFIDDMAAAYRWANVMICRAGASTVSEIAAVGLPAIFIPLPHAVDDHQTANARYLASDDAAYLLPQSELTPDILANLLRQLTSPQLRLEMASKAREKSHLQSAKHVAEQIISLTQLP